MSANTQTQEEKSEAESTTTLFDSTFEQTDTDESDPEETNPELSEAPDYIPNAGLTESIEALAIPVEKTLSEINPWEENNTLLHKEASSKDPEIGQFTVEVDRDHLEFLTRLFTHSIGEGFFSITEKGILLTGVDSSNTVMNRSWLSQSDYTVINLANEGIIGIPWSDMKDSLTNLSSSNTIIIELAELDDLEPEHSGEDKEDENADDDPDEASDEDSDEEDEILISDQFEMTVSTPQGEKQTVRVIDPTRTRHPPDLPDIDLTSNVSMPMKELSHIVKRYKTLSQHFLIEGTSKGVRFKAEGDTDTIKRTYTPDSTPSAAEEGIQDFIMNTKENDHSLFSLELFSDFFRGLKKNQYQKGIHLRFGDEFPIMMKTPFTGKSYVTFMVAPRIRSD